MTHHHHHHFFSTAQDFFNGGTSQGCSSSHPLSWTCILQLASEIRCPVTAVACRWGVFAIQQL
jgi:hypothetical protein